MILKKLLRKKNSADILKPDLIIVGLGNPEPHYARTRHNAGWWLIDLLAEKHGIEVGRAHSTTRLGVGTIGEYTVALAKPRTHVNGSGTAVRYLLARFRTTQDRLLIVYDETALPPGKLRLRPKGSAAGHNGIKSIIETLGNQDFARLRIGVGRPPPGGDMIGWVLGEMSAQDQDLVDEAIVRAGDSILYLMDDGVDVAMNKVN
ncbi:MAG: aminoacyl-tRNA hydrolase [Dehalococcoidia bacterium]|nr:aminoacyl-tRNA hydrolase [Dehalococcoidia bacterium]